MTNEEMEQRIAEISERIAEAEYLVPRRDRVEAITDQMRADTNWLIDALRSSRLDSARLDWLEDAIAKGNGPLFVEGEYVDHHLVMPSGFQIGHVGGTNLRAAIDVAKKQ